MQRIGRNPTPGVPDSLVSKLTGLLAVLDEIHYVNAIFRLSIPILADYTSTKDMVRASAASVPSVPISVP